MGYKCLLCNDYCYDTINLRTGDHVCKTCIHSKESQLAHYQNKLNELSLQKPPKNVWDIFLIIEIVAFIALGLYIYILTGNFVACIIVWVIGIWLSEVLKRISENKKSPHRKYIQNQMEEIEKESDTIQNHLHDIYKEFWDYPPDWEWRREQIIKRDGGCRRCGAKVGSELSFHVHHYINKAETNGNHSLDNLVLLCELHHSKEPGHDLIRNRRKNIKRTRIRRVYY